VLTAILRTSVPTNDSADCVGRCEQNSAYDGIQYYIRTQLVPFDISASGLENRFSNAT
jgi:hypothetical protein